MAVLSEHHAAVDGHLPSPLILASAIAARTKVLNILVAAAVLPLYHPVRLAEDIAVLDNLSKGRVTYVFGIGHRPEEYEHIGVNPRHRGRIADDQLALILELLKGEPVDLDGRRVHVTPVPSTPGGPRLMIAGGTAAAARRAGRHGLGFMLTRTGQACAGRSKRSLGPTATNRGPHSFPKVAVPQRFSSLTTSMPRGGDRFIPAPRRADGRRIPPGRRIRRQHHFRPNRLRTPVNAGAV